MVKNPPADAGVTRERIQSLGGEDALEEEMVSNSSVLAWRIPWAAGSHGLQSEGLQRVRHN